MNQKADSADQQPIKYKVMKVEKCAVFWAIAGILLYFADIISDISLAGNYYYNGHIKFFGLTIFLVILSAVVSSLFSFYMYWIDSKDEELKVPKKDWIVRTIFLVLGIAPVLRNVDSLCFALKSYESSDENVKQYYARRMVFEINDGSFLRLFEAFIETGPQLILQLYIFVEMQPLSPNIFTITEIWQCCTMLISAISISGCIVSYTNSLRNSLDKKNDLRWYLLPPLFLWRFFEVISRVIAMGLAISASPYFHIAFVVHFIIMTIWVYFLKTDFCDDRCAEKIYNVLLGVILTFVFLNPEDSPTKKRCIIYYVGMFVENTFLMVFWFHHFSCTPDHVPAMIIQVSSFFLGIMFMKSLDYMIFNYPIFCLFNTNSAGVSRLCILFIIYYEFFHPTVGKLYKKRAKECNNLKSNSETEMQNGEASAMLEMVKSAEITESVLQNVEANTMLETVQDDETVETRNCSF